MSGAAPLSAELTMHLAETLPLCSIGQGYGTSLDLCTFEATEPAVTNALRVQA